MSLPPRSRYAEVSRRTFLRRSLGVGAALAVPGLACTSDGDAEIFATTDDAAESATEATSTPTTAPVTTESTAPPVDDAESVTTTSAEPATTTAESTATTSSDAGIAAGSALVIDFTYSQQPGGKNLPPYLAVWIEDANDDLVETIALWYQQDQKGPKWLPDLKRWFRKEEDFVAAGSPDETDVISSATRLPGTYSLRWDGEVGGAQVVPGDYFICIESARERCPYSLIRSALPLTGVPLSLVLDDNIELVGASVSTA